MTHTFKLPSGVECEVAEFTGKQQRILTEQNKKPHTEKLAEMLHSVLIRVGSVTNVTMDFVLKEMLSCDKKFALTEARQFSLDHEDSFAFMHTYKDANNEKQTIEIEEKVPEGHFPMKKVMKLGEDGEFVATDYKEYSEIEKNIELVLPRSQKKVRFTMLDGKGEAIGVATKKNQISSHTTIKMRNPVYFEQKEKGGEVPISLNLDTLHIKDIEYLRKAIKDYEGRVDTEIMFEVPDSENKPLNERDQILDVISSTAFFFPSEAI